MTLLLVEPSFFHFFLILVFLYFRKFLQLKMCVTILDHLDFN